MKFTDFQLKAGILRGVEEAGYETATAIQEKVIPLALEWRNILWQSQTWTGKTAAFLLPLLNNIDTNLVEIQALILVPTRELVVQTTQEIFKLTKYYRVPAIEIFGGVSQDKQLKNLEKTPRIVVATPWRLNDLMQQGELKISTVKYFILDEADRMLDMWFLPSIKKIWAKMPKIKQTMCFSATLNDSILWAIQQHVKEYETIKTSWEIVVPKISHSYMIVPDVDKYANLKSLINTHKDQKIIIFTNTKHASNKIQLRLQQQGYKVHKLHGDMWQSKRLTTLNDFTHNKVKILVTTDVAARWLNMDSVELVINYDVPKDSENYIHRIGRTARAWARWVAIMFVTNKSMDSLKRIESDYKIKIELSTIKAVSAWQEDILSDKMPGLYPHKPNQQNHHPSDRKSTPSRTSKKWSDWSKPFEFNSRSSNRFPQRERDTTSGERAWRKNVSFDGRFSKDIKKKPGRRK